MAFTRCQRSASGDAPAPWRPSKSSLAAKWAAHNIRVNAIASGRPATASPSRAHKGTNLSYMEAMLKRIPLHRLASVEEVAAAAAITGQVLVLDGGLTAVWPNL